MTLPISNNIIPVDLNPPQRKAATHSDGQLLILAGAGSGKTRVLACRAAYLIHSGIARPYQILALTFTNKAAAELKSRVITMAGDEGKYIYAGTFHATFAKIMRHEGLNIGIDPNFTIVDADDRRRMIKNILSELNVPSNTVTPGQIEWMISNAKINLVDPTKYEQMARYPNEKTAARVYPIYENRLERMSGLDFDDLLSRPVLAFHRYPEFLERLQNRFRYIMVDEYQDTNHVQYMLVKEIAKANGNLCVVGDDDQSIYGWRGATIENILEFKRDWPDAEVVRLEQNYRSTKQILEVAWSVIKHNSERHPKKLWTDRIEGQAVELFTNDNEEEEATRYAALIQDENGIRNRPYKEFAILYRTNAQSLPFERVLRGAGIPYRIIGGTPFYQRKEIKDVLAYLRLIINPLDDVSLLRVINYPPRGIGDSLVDELQSQAALQNCATYQMVERAAKDVHTPARRRTALIQFINLIQRLDSLLIDSEFPMIVRELVNTINLRERLKFEEKEDPSKADSKIGNLDHLIDDIERYTVSVRENDETGTLTTQQIIASYLEEVSLVASIDEAETDSDRVNLMTLHTAKGLEFDVVMIAGVEEGLLPFQPSDGEPNIEEERRLFYVGATRAKERLALSYAVSRLRWNNQRWFGPSRYLSEIPRELLSINGRYAYQLKVNQNGPTQHSVEKPTDQRRSSPIKTTTTTAVGGLHVDDLRKGVLVKHGKFGVGIIVDFTKRGGDSRIQVDFDKVGRKTLVLKFANLELARG